MKTSKKDMAVTFSYSQYTPSIAMFAAAGKK